MWGDRKRRQTVAGRGRSRSRRPHSHKQRRNEPSNKERPESQRRTSTDDQQQAVVNRAATKASTELSRFVDAQRGTLTSMSAQATEADAILPQTA